jgi:thiamine transport system substrate-binding protein
VEFAGVLRGTPDPDAARAVVDWLVSTEVQADVPLSMFVFPARDFVALPEVFERFVTRPQAPLELDAAEIAAQRDQWIEQWTQVVLR